jgi:hypothetical protein
MTSGGILSPSVDPKKTSTVSNKYNSFYVADHIDVAKISGF